MALNPLDKRAAPNSASSTSASTSTPAYTALASREASASRVSAGRRSLREFAAALLLTLLLGLTLQRHAGGARFCAALSSVAQLAAAIAGAVACLVALRRLAASHSAASTGTGANNAEGKRGAAAQLQRIARARTQKRGLARQSWPWRLLAASLACFAVAHALSQSGPLLSSGLLGFAVPLGALLSMGGWLWAAQYGLLWLGLLLLSWPEAEHGQAEASPSHLSEEVSEAVPERRSLTRTVIDRLITVLAVLVVFWKTLLEPRLAWAMLDGGLAPSPLALKSLAFLFPVALVGHLFCGLMLVSAPRRRLGAATLLGLGGALALLLTSDSAYALRLLNGSYRAGALLDAGWCGAWLLLGVAALSESRHILLQHNQAARAALASASVQERGGRLRAWLKGLSLTYGLSWAGKRRAAQAWLPYAAAVGACAVLVGREVLTHSSALGRIAPILGLVTAVIARQMMTLADNVRLSERLRRANRDLERNVNDRTRHLSTLHGITSTLNSSLDDRAILQGIIDGIMPAVHADAGGIWLRDARRAPTSHPAHPAPAASPQVRRAPEPAASTWASPAHPGPALNRAEIKAEGGGGASEDGADEDGAEGSAGALIDWGAEWSPAYTQGFGDDVAGAIALRDQAIIAAITERRAAPRRSRSLSARALPGEKSLILLPIRWQGLLLGAIGLLQRAGEFGYEERALVESVALEAGTALQNARLYQEANRRADRDPVTELLNHRAMQQTLHSRLLKSRAGGESFAVVMMDMNNFKFFNDTYGHLAGDDVLRVVARALSTSCRADDVVGRYGGDEFIAILPAADAQGAREACARIAQELDRHHFEAEPGSRVPIAMAFGWSIYPHDGQTPLELTTRADAHLFENKRNGPNSFLCSLPLWQKEAGGSRAAFARRRKDASQTTPETASSAAGSSVAGSSEAGSGGSSTYSGGEAAAGEAVQGIFGGSFDVLDALVTAIDNKDRYTRRHSEEVTQLALMTGRELGFSSELLRAVRIAGLLHDVGKIAVPDLILRHPGRLGQEETRIMRQHPVFGALIVRDVAHQDAVVDGVRHHHERWDGRGYPDGLSGEDIPWMGRLLAMGDVFSALTTDRPYRKALHPHEALAEIEAGAESQFDPAFAAAFAKALRRELSRAPLPELIA